MKSIGTTRYYCKLLIDLIRYYLFADYLREDFSRLDAVGNNNHSWLAYVEAHYQHTSSIIKAMCETKQQHTTFTARSGSRQAKETALQYAERDGTRIFGICLKTK